MKICFPARKHNGENYASLDEMMGLIGREQHGSWLAGTNMLWHGGLHISTVCAPGSILNGDAAVPLQCMVGGEVVAWRLNQDYLTSTYNKQTLQYSSTFVLVKSTCKPDPDKTNSWLDFYSLYLGLAPLSAFTKNKCYKALKAVSKRKAGAYDSSAPAGQVVDAPQTEGTLAKDSRVIILQEAQFLNKDETHKVVAQPFGLAKLLDSEGKAGDKTFWVTLLPQYMAEDGEQYAYLPVWMQHAVAQGTFDAVVKPATPLELAAGDAVGFLAKDIDPAGSGTVDTSYFAHVEVLCADPRMPGFLNNPAGIKTGAQYVRIPSGKSLYSKRGEGEDSTFTAMSCVIVKDSGKILPVDKCHPLKDKQGKTWYEISAGSWMSQDDVELLHQYDLKELGFTALEEGPTTDMSKSLYEGWMKSAFASFSEQVNGDRGIQQQQVSGYYKKAMKNIDTDGNGKLSGEELFKAVHHPEMEIRNMAARMVVKHDSEWYGDSGDRKWATYFNSYDRLRLTYAMKWRDDMEWMSHVAPFNKGSSVWHMHPVMFLGALNKPDCSKLIWGETVDSALGVKKGCEFRKKVTDICSSLWGEEKKYEYANSLMACMAVETAKLFTSSVVRLLPKKNGQGEIITSSRGHPIRTYQAVSRQELIGNPSIAARNAVGLIQFTGPAVRQINQANGLNITKQQLALMDEIEQLDYVKLYFSSNKSLLNKVKSPDDIYLYIFCPSGVGESDGYALYSRQKDIDEGVNYYGANSSLDSSENGNHGNNDGVIQRSELLSRLNTLRKEGKEHINSCTCNPNRKVVNIGNEPSGPLWVNRFPTSAEVNDLLPIFSSAVQKFISAIKSSGGFVRVSATYRPVERAYLMHYSWCIAREGLDPTQVPPKDGVNIDWTHKGDREAATAAARKMVSLYSIAYKPVLSSRHTQRRAIDMTITNVVGKNVMANNGVEVAVATLSTLNSIGATYGVHKLISDPPHWSDDGH